MSSPLRHLPVAARPIVAAADAAVAAARDHDEAALGEAATTLAGLDQAQVGLVLGVTVRLLLEWRHPDGVIGDDIREVLLDTVRGAAWHPGVDPQAVLYLLAGALGIDQDEEAGTPTAESLSRHAALLLATQLGPAPALVWFEAALAEIEKTQLND